jgi:hypothetical protein
MFSIRDRYPTPPPRPIRRPIRPRRAVQEGRANLALLGNSAAVVVGNNVGPALAPVPAGQPPEVETLRAGKGEQR